MTEMLAADGKPFKLIELNNAHGMRVLLTDWGATWLACSVPVREQQREVLLRADNPQVHCAQGAYLGASVGRYANRIAHAQFTLNDRTFTLDANQDGKHQLHGGSQGFNHKRWQVLEQSESAVTFALTSSDGDQGFPGEVQSQALFALSDDNALRICYSAVASADTPLNLTCHPYFNLDGIRSGRDVLDHSLHIAASHYLPVDSEGIPQGELKAVAGTGFDFKQPKTIGQDFMRDEDQKATRGYDHAFLFDEQNSKKVQVRLISSQADLGLAITTNQAAIQVYTGNFLQGTLNSQGGAYANQAGVALETEALPDTPNHPAWWRYGGMSQKDVRYCNDTVFTFYTP
ncbi:galactose-1-epimerase [Pasteurellaceae bacterium HPA106]|uniref:galactose-1-epimerase n=1 Tax=Spirabiliibacterium pneumoniae TaxID=221400 RepID=UPI001AACED6B|nr:galactose-1-epimerase [Spirabiliibacterium pneumoniae]MBE2895627.1 galactose-1-epimerase [Spirabiliibacterium pneumoniae]